MARPSKALLKFVELYVMGPAALRGGWTRCSIAAGMTEEPNRLDPMVRRLIQESGGVVISAEDEAKLLAEREAEMLAVASEPPTVDAMIDSLTIAREAGVPWTDLRKRLSMAIEGIAKGEVRATAAQVSMIKTVLEEAKKEAADVERGARSVILLPVQGEAETVQLDETLRQKVEATEGQNEE